MEKQEEVTIPTGTVKKEERKYCDCLSSNLNGLNVGKINETKCKKF